MAKTAGRDRWDPTRVPGSTAADVMNYRQFAAKVYPYFLSDAGGDILK